MPPTVGPAERRVCKVGSFDSCTAASHVYGSLNCRTFTAWRSAPRFKFSNGRKETDGREAQEEPLKLPASCLMMPIGLAYGFNRNLRSK